MATYVGSTGDDAGKDHGRVWGIILLAKTRRSDMQHEGKQNGGYARLTFSQHDTAIDPTVGDELDGGVFRGIAMGVGGSERDQMGVGWMRSCAVEVEDGSQFAPARGGQRGRERIVHPVKDRHRVNPRRVAGPGVTLRHARHTCDAFITSRIASSCHRDPFKCITVSK